MTPAPPLPRHGKVHRQSLYRKTMMSRAPCRQGDASTRSLRQTIRTACKLSMSKYSRTGKTSHMCAKRGEGQPTPPPRKASRHARQTCAMTKSWRLWTAHLHRTAPVTHGEGSPRSTRDTLTTTLLQHMSTQASIHMHSTQERRGDDGTEMRAPGSMHAS